MNFNLPWLQQNSSMRTSLELDAVTPTKPSATTTEHSNASIQSSDSLSNTTSPDGLVESGQNSMVKLDSSQNVADLVRRSSSVRSLNAIIPAEQLTRRQRAENRGLINLKDAVTNKSTQHGYRLQQIIKRPQDIYNALHTTGIIDDYVEYTRGQLGYFERSFVTLSYAFLEERREDILEAIEDHTSYKAEDGYQWLQFACMFSYLMGYTLADSPVVAKLAEEFKYMNPSTINRILTAN
jgi:hypothetical protein